MPKWGEKMQYVLRKAAGLYWLVDICQEGEPCRMPLSMNEVGADIYCRLAKGMDKEHIADELSVEYKTGREEIMADIIGFISQLEKYGVEYNR